MAEGSEEKESVSKVIYTPIDPEDLSKGYKPKPIKQGPPTTISSGELPTRPVKRITYPHRTKP